MHQNAHLKHLIFLSKKSLFSTKPFISEAASYPFFIGMLQSIKIASILSVYSTL